MSDLVGKYYDPRLIRQPQCWICSLRYGGHGGPVYWLQRWHLKRVLRSMP